MELGVGRDEVDATRDGEFEVVREVLMELRVVDSQRAPRDLRRSFCMPAGSVMRGFGEQLVARRDVKRVKRMQVKYRFHVMPAQPLADLGRKSASVEQHELPIFAPHE